MKVEFEKKMKIASDLLSYCHLRGATEFHMDMTDKDGACIFKIKASPAQLSDEDMEGLNKKLHAPRHKEIEHDYWGLMGESENFSELTLVGMMCDEAEAEYADGVLTVTVKRHN
jgi:hypothetical protein